MTPRKVRINTYFDRIIRAGLTETAKRLSEKDLQNAAVQKLL
jgi:hypothetical protein